MFPQKSNEKRFKDIIELYRDTRTSIAADCRTPNAKSARRRNVFRHNIIRKIMAEMEKK